MNPVHSAAKASAYKLKATFLGPITAIALSLHASTVPSQLPDPDGQPGDPTKPVKVYILAGQSNMVGMGDLRGAKNLYDGVFLASDPSVPDGPFTIYKVGNYKVARLAVSLPNGSATDQPLAAGSFEVPENGMYQVFCGTHGGAVGTMTVNGAKVYARAAGAEADFHEVTLEAGKRHVFEIIGVSGEAPRFWLRKMDLAGHGDLESVVKRDGKFPWLVDDQGNWTVRNDVYFQEARVAPEGKGSPLSATSNGNSIGPELGFGHVLGEFHGEQVLLIKTAMGNRALGFDFRPPSSGRKAPDDQWEALEYKLMVEGVRKTLENIAKVVPGYQGQGYEIAGFVWFQGHKDSFDEALIAEYETNLANLVNDIRKEFKVPRMPAVVATVGFGGANMAEKFLQIHAAQMAVGDPRKHPEFAGTVASVDTRPFWREVDESPKNQDYHYHRNAETYLLVGDALGRAMVGLLGGQAEPQILSRRPAPAPSAAPMELTPEQEAALREARAPIILDGIVPGHVLNPRNNPALMAALHGERPKRANQFLNDAIDTLVRIYQAAGVEEYNWKVFGKDLRDAEWDYFTFDPADKPAQANAPRYRKVGLPPGMENWFTTDFDTAKAGWKKGQPPFGQLAGKPEPLRTCDRAGGCGCGEKPRTLWDKEVLMVRGTFDIPPLKDGHRYRVVIGGSNHVNAGEGYALYANGKLIGESGRGVGKREGAQPRGGAVYADVRNEFKGGKVTLAATSFLRGTPPDTTGHLTVWIEEQKLPPVRKAPSAAN